MKILTAFGLGLLLTAPVMAEDVARDAVAGRAVEEVIRPGFVRLHQVADSLEATLEGACFADTPEPMAEARDEFGTLVQAYGGVALFRLGPMVEENRAERLYFWPDRKGIALKQVQAMLATPVIGTIDVREKSIALQGIGTLEYILFGEGSDALGTVAGHERCGYAHAVAIAIEQTARELRAAWEDPEGISKRLSQPDPANADYRSPTEAMEAIAALLAHGNEAIRDTYLLPFVGRDETETKPKSAPLWRSGLTVRLLQGQFAGIEALYTISGIGETLSADTGWVDNGIGFELANSKRALAVLTSPVIEGLADPHQKNAYNYLVLITQSLETLLGENLPAALGLSVGFSSLDGD